MNYVKKCKLPTIKALQYNRQPCTELKDLWQALYQTFNLAQNCQVNIYLLDKIPLKLLLEQPNFSKEKFRNAIKECSNLSTLELEHVFQRYLKVIIDNNKYLSNIVNISNMYIDLSHQPSHLKMSTLIIIPKPNKVSYNSPKMFCPIVLFNILGKLIEKVIREKLQYQSINSNFIHSNQLDGLKQCLTTGADIVLTHLIHLGWVKGLQISILCHKLYLACISTTSRPTFTK